MFGGSGVLDFRVVGTFLEGAGVEGFRAWAVGLRI